MTITTETYFDDSGTRIKKETVSIDSNGDGDIDATIISVTHDSGHDGFPELKYVDSNGDGEFDEIYIDSDGDGKWDEKYKRDDGGVMRLVTDSDR